MVMKPITTNKRYRLVIEAIKNYIIEHKLTPGDKLPSEKELANALQVGRSSIREAVKSLEVLGIIESKPGEGMFVRSFNYDPIIENLSYRVLFDRDDLEEVLEVRISLELYNLKKVMENITAENIVKLESMLEKMKTAVKNNNQKSFTEADERFHYLLFKPVGNKLLLKLLNVFWSLLENAKDFTDLAEHNLAASYERHKKIFAALKNRDYDRLYRLIEDHYKFTEERIKNK